MASVVQVGYSTRSRQFSDLLTSRYALGQYITKLSRPRTITYTCQISVTKFAPSTANPCSTPRPEKKQPRLPPNIGVFVRSSGSQSDHERYDLIVHHFVPDHSYKFTRHADGRSFQRHWLMKSPWLKYSEQENGGCCLPSAFNISGWWSIRGWSIASKKTVGTVSLQLLTSVADDVSVAEV